MKQKRHNTEQIIAILREVDSARGIQEVCREHNISGQTYYRWRSKYGGTNVKEARRLKELGKENTELKKLLADQLLNIKALELALEKNI